MAALTDRTEQLVTVWQNLGAAGPTYGSPQAESPEESRRRYLTPLAASLLAALRGSAKHAALYFDERQRYVDAGADPSANREMIRTSMQTEVAAIAEMLSDRLPREAVEAHLLAFNAPFVSPPAPAQRILFIGDCLFVEARAFLVPRTRDRGVPAEVRQVFFSSRQPLDGVNTAIVDTVRSYSPHLIGISLFTFEGVPPYSFAWRAAAVPGRGRKAMKVVPSLIELVRETLSDIRSVSDATIAVHIPGGLPLDGRRRKYSALPPHSRTQKRFLTALAVGLEELVCATSNTLAIREADAIQRTGGLRDADNPAFDEVELQHGFAHTTALGPALAQAYDEVLSDYHLLARAKVLLVDFDNTLWQGAMAEGDVLHNNEGQRLLRELKDAGVLLVALSKNEQDAIRWNEMLLTPDDFALRKINWLSKPDNVSAAIRELDLGADAFVLLDDNPVERALVTEQVTGVRALDPTDPAAWDTLRRWFAFPSTGQTAEARRRTEMYQEAVARRAALGATHDYGAMMSTLDLRFAVRRATANDTSRLLELIQRTNQFNTTTRRYTAAEVDEKLRAADVAVYVASLRDRFGDLGVVATALVDTESRTFDSVIMSCRAMGFGLELALLHCVMADLGAGEYHGLFIASERNAPAADLFRRACFTETTAGSWKLGPGSGPEVPEWLTRTPS